MSVNKYIDGQLLQLSGNADTRLTLQDIVAILGYTPAHPSNIAETYATTEYTDNTFIPKTDVVDNVTSTDTDKPLSAKQGKELNDKIATTGTRLDQQIGTNFIKEYDFQSNNFDITTVVGQNNYGLHMIRTTPTTKPSIGLPNSIKQWGTLIIFNCLYKQILYISQDGELAVYGADTKKWSIVTMVDDTDQLDAET